MYVNLLDKLHQENNNKQELCHTADNSQTDSSYIELSETNKQYNMVY